MNTENVKKSLSSAIGQMLKNKDLQALLESSADQVLSGMVGILRDHEARAVQHAKDVATANAIAASIAAGGPVPTGGNATASGPEKSAEETAATATPVSTPATPAPSHSAAAPAEEPPKEKAPEK